MLLFSFHLISVQPVKIKIASYHDMTWYSASTLLSLTRTFWTSVLHFFHSVQRACSSLASAVGPPFAPIFCDVVSGQQRMSAITFVVYSRRCIPQICESVLFWTSKSPIYIFNGLTGTAVKAAHSELTCALDTARGVAHVLSLLRYRQDLGLSRWSDTVFIQSCISSASVWQMCLSGWSGAGSQLRRKLPSRQNIVLVCL